MRKALASLLSFSILTASITPAFAEGRPIQTGPASQTPPALNAAQLGTLGAAGAAQVPALANPHDASIVDAVLVPEASISAPAEVLPSAAVIAAPSASEDSSAPTAHSAPSSAPGSPTGQAPASSGRNLDPNIRAALNTVQGLLHPAAQNAPGAQASADGQVLFDGAKPAASSLGETALAHLSQAAHLSGRLAGKVPILGRLVPARFSGRVPPAKTALDHDDYGGPPYKALSIPGRLFYGAKWSVHLFAIYSLINLLNPLLNAIPWPLYLSHQALAATGRVELLTQMGPNGIVNMLAQYPIQFLFSALPNMAFSEEIIYRLLRFAVPLIMLASLRPLSAKISGAINDVEDFFHLRSFAQRVLGLTGKISSGAYALAALWSAYAFTTAHFAAWGIHPHTILTHFALGLALTRAAYRTRSLLAPFVAHYLFNLMTISASFLIPIYYGTDIAKALMAGAGIISLISLGYNYWANRQDKAALRKGLVPASGPIAQTKKTPHALLGLGILYLALNFALPLAPWSVSHLQHKEAQARQPAQAQQTSTLPTLILPDQTPKSSTAQPLPNAASSLMKKPIPDMVEQAKPAVINFFVRGSDMEGTGSGFIIDKSGLAVTNAHVAKVAASGGMIGFRLAGASPDSPVLPAQIISINDPMDVALIQLPAALPNGWPTLKLAKGVPKPGEPAIIVGFPRGLPFSVSQGIVSGIDFRTGDSFGSSPAQIYLQMDTAINPGNSGGPLLNGEGEVIGINSMHLAGSSGLGLAIRVDSLAQTLAQYKRTGTIEATWFGLIINPSANASPMGLSIEYVRPGSPADKAGLKSGDIIVAAAGTPLQTNSHMAGHRGSGAALATELVRRAGYLSPGETLPLTVLREGEEQPLVLQVPLILGSANH